jgi:hypothetical protein
MKGLIYVGILILRVARGNPAQPIMRSKRVIPVVYDACGGEMGVAISAVQASLSEWARWVATVRWFCCGGDFCGG